MKIKFSPCFSFILSVSFSISALSQPKGALKEVVDAELGFASVSREQGTRQAFLTCLSAKGFLYSNGEIVNGIEKWKKSIPDSSLLNWWPIYADVSISGDFGYTTGPWQYFQNREDKTSIANGFYATLWKKEADGKWRVATDLGIGTRDKYSMTSGVNSPKAKGEKSNVETVNRELVSLEAKYLSLLNASSISYQADYLAEEFRIHRPLNTPCTSKEKLSELSEERTKFIFEYAGMDIALSGDIAYTYGKVNVKVNRDNAVHITQANYVRVWKRIDGKWKIVLDVIGLG